MSQAELIYTIAAILAVAMIALLVKWIHDAPCGCETENGMRWCNNCSEEQKAKCNLQETNVSKKKFL